MSWRSVKTFLLILMGVIGTGAAMPLPAGAQVCNGLVSVIGVNQDADFLEIGEGVNIMIALGSDEITGGASNEVTIDRFRVELDCQGVALLQCESLFGLNDGETMAWGGIQFNNCPTTWSCSHVAGQTVPNEVVCDADTPVVIPAETNDFCRVAYRKTYNAVSTDVITPEVIEEAVGFLQTDAICDNGLPTGDQRANFVNICPTVCDDGFSCTVCSVDATGDCESTPDDDLCEDMDPGTSDTCAPGDPGADPEGCVFDPIDGVTVPTMNEWGMIIFTMLAGFVAVRHLRRQMLTF